MHERQQNILSILFWISLGIVIGQSIQTNPNTSSSKIQEPVRVDSAQSYKVTGVADGDTIYILCHGVVEKVRLNGIDCPESSQPFGDRAMQFTSDLVSGTQVKLMTIGRDGYGRLLADVLLPDGRSLCQELARSGLAWHYKRYSDDPVLANLESEARSRKRMLWSEEKPLPPWEYRQSWRFKLVAYFHSTRLETTLLLPLAALAAACALFLMKRKLGKAKGSY